MSIDYDRLRELIDKVPPGPWEVKVEETSTCGDLIEGLAAWVEADSERVFGGGMEIEEDEELTNLALAALAPDMARELLRLHRELTDLRDPMLAHEGYLRRVGQNVAANYVHKHERRLTQIIQGDTE